MAGDLKLTRRGALAAAGGLGFGAMRAEAQHLRMRYGGPVPMNLFIGARYFDAGAWVLLWQRGGWLDLDERLTTARPAQPTDMFSYGLVLRASHRAAEVLSRVPVLPSRGNRPRFARIDSGPHDPTPEERAERVYVTARIQLRDVTEDFPSPIPRGLRMMAVMTVIYVARQSADPELAGEWVDWPNLTIEAMSPRSAEDRVLELLESELARRFTVFRWGGG